MKKTDPIFEFLTGFRALTNTYTIFRTANETNNGLYPSYCFHYSPFCLALKNDQELLVKCKEDCAQKALNKAKSSDKPFVKTCHAGVKDIVCPIYSNGIYKGSLFIGPYGINKTMNNKIMDDLYKRLPVFSGSYQKAAEKLFSSFSVFLMNESEKILLSSAERGTGNEKIQKAFAQINAGLSSKLSAGTLAKECGLSTSRFIHLFKEKTGYSLTNYIVKMRLEKAKTILSAGNLKISEIALECGYSNQNYFSLAFKKYTGMSPTKYKEAFVLEP